MFLCLSLQLFMIDSFFKILYKNKTEHSFSKGHVQLTKSRTELQWTGLDCTGQERRGQDRRGRDRIRRDRTGQDGTGLDWTGEKRTGPDGTKLDWKKFMILLKLEATTKAIYRRLHAALKIVCVIFFV